MKSKPIHLLILTLLLLSSNAMSQSGLYFPLNVGDTWWYSITNDLYPGNHCGATVMITVEADTLMPNGLTYKRIPAMVATYGCKLFPDTKHYLRVEDQEVFQYIPRYNLEILRFDFSAQIGDTLSQSLVSPFWADSVVNPVVLVYVGTEIFIGLDDSLEVRRFGGSFPFTVADSIGIASQWDPGGTGWRLRGARVGGNEYGEVLSSVPIAHSTPSTVTLYQNYPNPFNSSTSILFELTSPEDVEIAIFDVLGREVYHLPAIHRTAGFGRVSLALDILPSGVYWCRLTAGRWSQTKFMVHAK